jgi:MFS family permease
MHQENAYRTRDFAVFIFARFLASVAMLVQSVAVGWQIYDLTRNPLALGLVGLSQFVPMFLLTLPAGEISDRLDQRRIYGISLLAQSACAGIFLTLTLTHARPLWTFYAILALFGAARGFASPASQSLLPFLVPRERLPRALAVGSSTFQAAILVGPAFGGLLYVRGPETAYAACCACLAAGGIASFFLGGRRPERSPTSSRPFERVTEGVRFVRARPIILGAISLDLFAVLLGGATALLPVFARDILHVGPVGLGLLRSAPALGAGAVGIALGAQPLDNKIGPVMFASVAAFGVATIVFGLSRNFYVSLAALAVLGAFDMISVFVRHALVQFATPDAMRGRVSAVNVLFIGASNELGEFESGFTATLFGTVPSVVLGGIGTLLVVAAWAWIFPPLRRVDRLSEITV